MNERAFQVQVHALLRARPELVWHHCGAPLLCAGHAGLPDLFIIGPHRMIWRELKPRTRSLRPEQRDFGQALTAVGQSWGVWRPEDITSGRIQAELDELLRDNGS